MEKASKVLHIITSILAAILLIKNLNSGVYDLMTLISGLIVISGIVSIVKSDKANKDNKDNYRDN